MYSKYVIPEPRYEHPELIQKDSFGFENFLTFSLSLQVVCSRGFFFQTSINNGNRTEWSPIRSVIIRVINKIRPPHR